MISIIRDKQYYKFCAYGFLKNLRFFDAFLILFLLEKGLNFTQIGVLYALREIIINVFEIPSGIFADTYGRKISLVNSFILYIISFIIFYLSSDFFLFAIAFISFGIGDAFRSGTHKGMIMQYLKLNNWENHKIKYYGHTRSWSQLGLAISSLAAGVIVFYDGNYQNIFLFTSFPYFINLLLILSYPRELNKADSKEVTQKISVKKSLIALINSLKKPTVFSLINSTALHTGYLKAIKDYIQPMILNAAILVPILINIESKNRSGLFIGVIYFFIYLLTSYASKFSSRVFKGNKIKFTNSTLVLGFISGVICGLFYINDLVFLSIISFAAIFIIENLRKPVLTGIIADKVPNEVLVSVLSAQSLLKTTFTSIIAIGFGILADIYGIGVSILLISSTLIAYSILINIVSKKESSTKPLS